MRARRTSECGMLRERTIACSCKRSASSIVKALFGLPIRATSPAIVADAVARVILLMGHYTSLEMTEVNYRGENVASLLLEYERQPVHEKLEKTPAPKLRFLKQVEAWLAEFSA